MGELATWVLGGKVPYAEETKGLLVLMQEADWLVRGAAERGVSRR